MELEETNFFRYYHDQGGLSLDQIKSLSPYYKFKEVEVGQYLLRDGEVCNQMFFVERGLLISFSSNEAGKEHIIQFGPENWILSDRSSMYLNEPSPYYIRAIEQSTIVYISEEFLQQATSISAEFVCFNDRALHRNIYFQQRRIQSLLAMSAKDRYLAFVKLYPALLLRVPQWMIASYLGITPESLSRVRREILYENGW